MKLFKRSLTDGQCLHWFCCLMLLCNDRTNKGITGLDNDGYSPSASVMSIHFYNMKMLKIVGLGVVLNRIWYFYINIFII